MQEMLILVDELDNEIGVMEKLQAHIEGKLHRAISVFLFNNQGQMLLQQRARGKYHSAGLWSNTCCSHPRPGEDVLKAAHRRLLEEMGICSELNKVFHFIYKVDLDHDLTEHELDHVFVGLSDAHPKINPDEVCNWKWVSREELETDLAQNPQHYTTWFKMIWKQVYCLNLPDHPSLVRKVEK